MHLPTGLLEIRISNTDTEDTNPKALNILTSHQDITEYAELLSNDTLNLLGSISVNENNIRKYDELKLSVD